MEFTEKQIKNFNAFVEVQKSGRYNMIMQASDAAKQAGLTLKEYTYVIVHYDELMSFIKK